MSSEVKRPKRPEPNYAFIDGQNLFLGARDAGIKLDYSKFRIYLKDKYKVKRAYIFIGYIASNSELYSRLQEDGFLLKFKPVLPTKQSQEKKGNVDADLAFNVMRYYTEYKGAVIVTSDGDFDNLVKHLKKKGKLAAVMSPNKDKCSALLQKAAGDSMFYLKDVGKKIER